MGGRERQYTMIVPDKANPLVPLPLLILLQGEDGEPSIDEDAGGTFLSGLRRASMLTVIPRAQGRPRAGETAPRWNDGITGAGGADAGGEDDIALIRALLPALRPIVTVDPKRVYLVGHSSGATFAHRAAAELGDMVAAVVAVGGSVGCAAGTDRPERHLPKPKAPVSILAVHGPKQGIPANADGRDRSPGGADERCSALAADESVVIWRGANGCSSTPKREVSEGGKAIRETYACEGDTEVVSIRVSAMGRAWPEQIEGKPGMRVVTEFLRGKKRD